MSNIGTRWYKVFYDLWNNRGRTLIVALAVAVGVYAVGTLLAAQTLMLREFGLGRANAQIASAIITTYPFDAELAKRVTELPGIAAAEGRSTVGVRVLVAPDTRRNLDITVVDDFDAMQVDKYLPVAGAWPEEKGEIMLEWLGLDFLNARIGDTLTLELNDGTRKELVVSGSAHDPQQLSPEITSFTGGIVSPETMVHLGLSHLFNELHLRVDADHASPAGVAEVVAAVEDRIERSDREVLNTYVVGRSMVESIVDTAVAILTAFGWIILLLSGFLVINTISALIAQQINQIGVMKLVGAAREQMAAMYITLVLTYGVLACLIAIPLAVVTAQLLITDLVAGLVNLRPASLALPPQVYLVMFAVGTLIPLAAGLLPVWQGTRVTTYAALNDIGIHAEAAGHGLVERMMGLLPRRWLQRPLLLSVRNAVRHKGRLLRTMIVMVLGTALFIGVISVRQSVDTTQADFLHYHQYDVRLTLAEPERIPRLAAIAAELPDVVSVEGWGIDSALRQRPDGSESNRYAVYGLPAETPLVAPVVQAGRWLKPDDDYAVVINATVAKDEPDLQIGDTIVLDMADRDQPWTVVGIVSTDAQGPKIYMNYAIFAYETRTVGKANSLQVTTSRHSAVDQRAMESILLNHFENRGIDVRSTRTTQRLNAQNGLMFDIIVGFLILMAVLLGAVGSLGLSTTMSINITERIREIGVLRAIGASNGAIRRIVLLEGIVIAVVSWVIGFVLSYPAAQFMSRAIGVALLDMPLTFTYALPAALIWFAVLLVLAVIASLGPARSAVTLTIREVLAYE